MKKLLIFFGCLFVLVFAYDSFAEIKQVQASRTESIKIDGILEDDWFRSQPASDFIQIRPREGVPADFSTDVYVHYNEHSIYFAFVNHDPEPHNLHSPLNRRDRIGHSDRVRVYMDTFHDKRNGYYFTITSAGVQADGTVTNENNHDSTWDGVWESAVSVNGNNWTAELRIPLATIRHGGSRDDGWGVNFTRWVDRTREWSSWQPINRERGTRISELGNLAGIENIKAKAHVEILPHALFKWEAPEGDGWQPPDQNWYGNSNQKGEIGLDMKIIPANNWSVDLTLFPDFAQVDVDEAVINLSDYPIYLREKRPFFLEGKELFDSSPIELFYTRRVTNPDYGTRVTGRWGNFRSSAIAARNVDEDGYLQSVGAARGTFNIGKRSTLSFTTTHLDGDALDSLDRPQDLTASSAGIDTRIRFGKDNTFSFAFAGVDRDDPTDTLSRDAQPFSSRYFLSLRGEHLRGTVGGVYRGMDFDINDLGWTGYSNTLEHWAWMGYYYTFEESWLERMGLNMNVWQDMQPDGRYGQGGGNFNCHFSNRHNYWFGGGFARYSYYRRNYVDEDDEIWNDDLGEFVRDFGQHRDNYGQYNPEAYFKSSQWIWFETDGRKPLSWDTHYDWGTFRDGYSQEITNEVEYRPLENLETEIEVDWERIWSVSEENDGDVTDYQIYRWRTRWSPTLDLSFRATIQYIKDSEELLSNFLVAWNWAPGSWLYVVYDEGRYTHELSPEHFGDRTIQAKMTWWLSGDTFGRLF